MKGLHRWGCDSVPDSNAEAIVCWAGDEKDKGHFNKMHMSITRTHKSGDAEFYTPVHIKFFFFTLSYARLGAFWCFCGGIFALSGLIAMCCELVCFVLRG